MKGNKHRVTFMAGIIALSLSGCAGVSMPGLSGAPPVEPVPAISEQAHLGPVEPGEETTALYGELSRFRPRPEDGTVVLPRPVNGRLSVTIEDAVFLTLRNNRSLAVQLYKPLVAGTFEEQERARFDPSVFGEAAISRDRSEQTPRGAAGTTDVRSESDFYRIGIDQTLPTGTGIDLSFRQNRSDSGVTGQRQTAGVQMTLTQALLRGSGLEANLARVRRAELNTLASHYEVRGFTEALVAETELTYWDYVLARRRIVIFEDALCVARDQAADIERRIEVGTIAETELAAAQAELASRRQGLLDALNQRDRIGLSLLRLMNPPDADGWSLDIEPMDGPRGLDVELDTVEDHLDLGLRMRPELSEAHLRIEQGRLDVVETRKGLLPRLDLFVTLGKTGYADSFGGSLSRLDGSYYDTTAGTRFEWTLFNRAAEAADTRARATLAQARASLDNLAQLVVQDIRDAWLEVKRAQSQIEASTVRRRWQEEVLRAEQVKFDVGRGTALTVAQAQRDLLESRLDEIKRIIDYRKARIYLYLLDGSLLRRRGIETAGISF
ncbi:MAG: TolC family protein [Syntrophales bacterium]|jgi:outer membrane protein TolC|nr:TolC family protein [Syntrophales bacterium]MCK9528908.1 TolC family protein [Syntrophales bacterium]MDX9922631.1 TolC family protein [Syntrophales bacterium]